MRPAWFIWALVVVVACLSATGCRTTPAKSSGSGRVRTISLRANEPPSEADMRARAKAHAHFATGIVREMNELPDLALEEFYQAAFDAPDDQELVLDVSRRFLHAKQFDKALQLVKRSAARPGASGLIYARLGLIHAQLGQEEEALAASRTAVARSPKSLPGYQNLFMLHLQKKRFAEAIAVLDQAAGQTDTSFEFLHTLAELYSSVGAQAPAEKEEARRKALAVLTRAEKLSSIQPPQRLMLAEQLNALGDRAAAARVYEELLKTGPRVPMLRERILQKLSEIYLQANDYKRAAERLESLAAEDPTNPQIYLFLGSIALEQKDAARAVDNLSRVLLLRPDLEQAYYELANAQLMADKPADALVTLQKARRVFRETFAMEFLSALAYSRQKDYKQAVARFTAAELLAQASDPKRLTEFFYFQFGAACERGGDFDQAEKHLRKALEVAPGFVEALNYLGYMWADLGKNLDEARELIEKALKAEPESAAYLDSLAWVYFKQGRPSEALEQMLKALKHMDEPDAVLFDHLGDIYSALGDREKALEAWRKSLTLEDNEKVKQKLERAEQERAP